MWRIILAWRCNYENLLFFKFGFKRIPYKDLLNKQIPNIIHCNSRNLFRFFSTYIENIESRFLSTSAYIGVLAISFYLSTLIGRAKIKLVFTKEALLHKWERRFLFSREKDITIPWKIIDNYVFEGDRTWDSFIINLSTKMRYKINRLNIIPLKDDFDKFVKDFPRLSNKFKKQVDSEASLNSISEGKSKYESKSFRQSVYVLLIAFIILCIVKIISSASLKSWVSLGVIGCAIAYYWLMMKTKKKKNTADKK